MKETKKWLLIIFVTMSIISCKKEIVNNNKIEDIQKDTSESNTNITGKVINIDTLKLEKLATLRIADKLVITTLRKKISKDSLKTAFFRLDFYNKNKLFKSFELSIPYETEGFWYCNENVFENIKDIDYRFVEIGYGFDACGYTHTKFLFFIDKNICQLITKNLTMMDSGYGTYIKYEPLYSENQLVSFSSKIIQVDIDESKPSDENNDFLLINYYDSIVYTQRNNKWIGKLKTTKDKLFRTETKKFNDYYKN